MVRAGYASVKAARPDVTVLIGNTSSTGGKRGSGAVPPLEFLRTLACVDANLQPIMTDGCAEFMQIPGDGWAHHPYSQNERPSRVSNPVTEPGDLRMADLPLLAATLNQLVAMGRIAPAVANIYLTEFGYETKGIPGRPRVNEIQQARWLTWAEYIADSIPTVHSFAQFLLRDQPPSATRVSSEQRAPVRGVLDRPAEHRRHRQARRQDVPRRACSPSCGHARRSSSTVACGSAPAPRSSRCSAP